jgi:hypothetical protein
MEDVKLAVRQQGLVAFELYGATYGSGGIGRESTNFSVLAQSYITTQLQTDVLTVKTEHALATNSASFFGTFEFLALSMLFFVVSLCLFVHSLVLHHRIETEKKRPLLDLLTKSSSHVTSKRSEESTEENEAFSTDDSCSSSSSGYQSPTPTGVQVEDLSKVQPCVTSAEPCTAPIYGEKTTFDDQISCMDGVHLHLNALDGEQEGSGIVHDACMALGGIVHNVGERISNQKHIF